ncbi:MAG: hypothetical protein R3E44_02915 [Paracoccaceae bacterium]
MTIQSRHIALVLTILTAGPAFAEPATPEGAARLTSVFETYLGSTPGVVTVSAEGESYLAVFDPAPFVAMGADAGVTGTVTPITLTLTDRGGGKWGVVQDEPLGLTLEVPNVLKLDVGADNWRWSGVFDEAIQSFESSELSMSGMRVEETVMDPAGTDMEIAYTIDSLTSRSTAVAAAGGGVDAKISYRATGIVETVAAKPSPDMPMPINATFRIDTYDVDGDVKGMRTASVYTLVAWAVAHSSEAEVQANLGELSGLIGDSLPIFESISMTGDLTNVLVESPFGGGGVERARIEVELNGVVEDGYVREMIALKGLTLPEELMPGWVPALLPDEVSIDFAIKGFNLADPAQILLEAMAKDQKPDDAMEARLLDALLPDGTVKMAFGPGGASSDVYAVDFNGTMEAAPDGEPHGKWMIGASGIDAVLEALNKAPDDVRQGAVPAIMLMRGMAKPEGEDRFVWNIEVTPEGTVLVNDVDMSAMSPKE